ncbi:MAG: SUMF1/EgtB/PvdO family nonheme iron enzyme [Muribaculaceae bacterium]|nr:SUMF1/EgtB/PvdO family nonheme iron enzyme [Muribaculaceae bacterium]
MTTQKQYKYTLPIGFVLRGGENDYVIEQVLGKGGFGVTYKVKSRVIHGKIPVDVFFAVKEYFPDICSREADNATIIIPETKEDEVREGLTDFINEGKRLHQVCDLNPNIVNVNEVFEANGTAYYVMEYLEGGDLRKMVRDNGKPLTEKQMLDIMRPIGKAVQCLHDNRILHLDIKPDNIVMRRYNDGREEPVLIDFGIAVHFKNNGTPTSKNPSQGVSPGYSPVEQYAKYRTFDPRLDVYAFCATCLYLLTGKDPLEAHNMTPALIKSALPKDLEPKIADTLVRGMNKEKEMRTGTIKKVLEGMGGTIILPPHGGSDGSRGSKKKTSTFKKYLSYFVFFLLGTLCAGLAIWGIKACKGEKKTKDTIKEGSVLTFEVNGVEFDMVLVEGGTFTMGATDEQGSDAEDDEKPPHEVDLSSYYIGQTEVTQELWVAVMGENPSWFNGSNHNGNYGTNLKRPVEYVSWDDCQEFIRRLNKKTGKQFRLPTEAEWEYAACGGNRSQVYKYSGSNNIGDVAWYHDNSGEQTHDVATKRANELGIYDMSGNVWEWCNDLYGDYSSSSQSNPQGPASESYRVSRGGSWDFDAKRCLVSYRSWFSADSRYFNLGVRLAL